MSTENPGTPPSPAKSAAEDLAPFFRYGFNRDTLRMHIHYTGFWTDQIASEALKVFRSALQSASVGGRAFTLLDDCSDWPAQKQEVAVICSKFVDICRDFPVSRNAMIIPNAIVRMQVRRTLTNFDVCNIFGTYEEADKWLAEVEPKA